MAPFDRSHTSYKEGTGNFKYPERLRQLDLPTLAYRRNRGDMIVTYKLLSGLYDEQVTLQLDMATIGQHHTRVIVDLTYESIVSQIK